MNSSVLILFLIGRVITEFSLACSSPTDTLAPDSASYLLKHCTFCSRSASFHRQMKQNGWECQTLQTHQSLGVSLKKHPKSNLKFLQISTISIGIPQTMLLNMNGAKGDVECKIITPSGIEDDCFISPLGDGEHSVRFVPKEEGAHFLVRKLKLIHFVYLKNSNTLITACKTQWCPHSWLTFQTHGWIPKLWWSINGWSLWFGNWAWKDWWKVNFCYWHNRYTYFLTGWN